MNNVAIYARLSVEDLVKTDLASKSINNQIKLLKEYAINHNFNIYDYYIDDGYSGANFNRPNFKRLIQDINNKKINIILVKDISRIGRDLINTCKYIDEIFPRKNIRLIAINDEYDSINQNDDISIVIKSFLNSLYLKETIIKQRISVDRRSSNSYFLYKIPYGYKKNNQNEIVLDNKAQIIVKKIYMYFLNGLSIRRIATKLKEEKILTPNNYKNIILNKKYHNVSADKYHWRESTVYNILKRYEYCGHAVNLDTIKSRKKDTIIINNTHPAIICEKEYNKVQEILTNKKSQQNNNYLKKIVYCKKCNKRMVYKSRNNKYMCSVCNNKIKADLLHMVLIQDIFYLCNNMISNSNLKKTLEKKYNEEYYNKINLLINNKNHLLNEIKNNFEKMVNEKISIEMYELNTKNIQNELLKIEELISLNTINKQNRFKELYKFITNIKEKSDMNLYIIKELINKVLIDNNIINIIY